MKPEPKTPFEGYVIASLEGIQSQTREVKNYLDRLNERVGDTEIDIANMKGNASFWGGFWGGIAGIAAVVTNAIWPR